MDLSKILHNIIENSKYRIRNNNISYDRHRILPGFEGGIYDDITNIVYLTRKEHRIVHHIRFRLFGHWQDYQAARVLGQRNYRNPWNKGKKFGPLPEYIKKKMSDHWIGKSYEELYGKEKADSIKKKRSNRFKEYRNTFEPWNKGKKCPQISEHARNRKPISEETRKKMRLAKLGKPSNNKIKTR